MAQAFGYLRKSSVRDMATETSIETQEREVRNLAARFGDTDITLKSDWDVSGAGKYTKRRSGYLELREAIDSGRCSAVYSYSLSRLGRSVHELSSLFDLCTARNVPLRLVVDAVDTSTASGRLLANVLASVAQFESEVASERQNARNTTKRLAGESLRTRKQYGERDGDEPDTVLRVFREVGSYSRAAKHLNAMGLPAKDGKAWWGSSVRVVVMRLDPSIVSSGRGRRAIGAFELSRLLICPTCRRFLTGGNTPQRRYACRAGELMPHPKLAVAEGKVLPWVRERMTGYILPGRQTDTSQERRTLNERMTRTADLYTDGLIDRTELAKRSKPITDALAVLDASAQASESIDWTAGPGEVNWQLRTLLQGIELSPDLTPRKLVWHLGLNVRWTEDSPTLSERVDRLIAEGGRVLYSATDEA